MSSLKRLLCASACLLPAACSTPGGGPAGIVLFDPHQHVSGANPLFGGYENQCFRDPTYGLSFTTPAMDITKYPSVCANIVANVRLALGGAQGSRDTTVTYTKERRNEIIDNFVASSNAICSDHIRFLQQWDGNINSTLGLSTDASAGLAAIVNGTAARVAAAAAAFLGSARGTMQNAYFNNKTVAVLVTAFDGERTKIRSDITTGEQSDVGSYSISKGIADVLRYHSACSIAVGQDAAQRAVDQAQNPNLDTIKDFLNKVEEVRAQAAAFVKAAPSPPPPPPAAGQAPPAAAPAQPPTPPSNPEPG